METMLKLRENQGDQFIQLYLSFQEQILQPKYFRIL